MADATDDTIVSSVYFAADPHFSRSSPIARVLPSALKLTASPNLSPQHDLVTEHPIAF